MANPTVPVIPAAKRGNTLTDIAGAMAGFGAGIRAETEAERQRALEKAMQGLRERQIATAEGQLGLGREQFGFQRGEVERANAEAAASRPALLERINQLSTQVGEKPDLNKLGAASVQDLRAFVDALENRVTNVRVEELRKRLTAMQSASELGRLIDDLNSQQSQIRQELQGAQFDASRGLSIFAIRTKMKDGEALSADEQAFLQRYEALERRRDEVWLQINDANRRRAALYKLGGAAVVDENAPPSPDTPYNLLPPAEQQKRYAQLRDQIKTGNLSRVQTSRLLELNYPIEEIAQSEGYKIDPQGMTLIRIPQAQPLNMSDPATQRMMLTPGGPGGRPPGTFEPYLSQIAAAQPSPTQTSAPGGGVTVPGGGTAPSPETTGSARFSQPGGGMFPGGAMAAAPPTPLAALLGEAVQRVARGEALDSVIADLGRRSGRLDIQSPSFRSAVEARVSKRIR